MIVSPFDRTFDRARFSCGVPELDHYLKKQASQDIKNKVAACYLLHEKENSEILGYYTLAAFSIRLEGINESLRKKLPRYPMVPATLVGRLAISKAHQGKGFGEALLFDALKRSFENQTVIGSWATVVDAKDEGAAKFYESYGFLPEVSDPLRLYLPMKTVGQLLS